MNENYKKAKKTIILSLLANICLAILKAFVGIVGNSYALIADAIESTSDVFSTIIIMLGFKYANKPADEDHPYGHGKIEPLITFIVVLFLIGAAILIAYKSIQNIATPHPLPKAFTLYFLALVIFVKELFYRIISKKAKETNSTSLEADAWHHRSDAISSVMAFIGISIALYLGEGYEAADDYAALFASLIIVYNAIQIAKPAFHEVMDRNHHQELIDEIRLYSIEVNGVLATEKCFVRKSGLEYYVDLHIEVNGAISVFEGHEISHRLKDHLIEKIPEIADVLIHIEPI